MRTDAELQPLRVGTVALALAILAASCGGGEATYDAGSPDGESPAGSGPSDTVRVVLGEYFIEMPDTLSASVRALAVENRGMHVHDLRVRPGKGDSALVVLEPPLDPGASGVLSLDLAPGRYYLNCEVANHEGRGMYHTVVVAPPGG